MKKFLLPLFALAGSAVAQNPDPALARLENSPRHQEWVAVKRGDKTIQTFVVYPEVKDKALTVLVIHENRGLNDWARSVADRLAEHGYIAVAPDLLSGMAPGGGNTKDFATQGDATRAIGQLKAEDVVADLNAVADYAKAIPAATGRLALIGFCWGGSQTWRFANARTDLVLACPFYGTGPADAAGYAGIAAPVHGFYGGNDARVNATIDKSVELMKAAGKFYEPVLYDGAGHGFMRAGEAADASEANRKGHEEGWKRLLALLAKAAK